MPSNDTTLHLVCGKIASGKSTLVTELGRCPGTVIVREDFWLSRLYPGEQNSVADYARNATRLRDAISSHLVDLLRNGLSVVLDFPANTPSSRAWMRTLFEDADCLHQLHYLDVTEQVCKARLKRRNEDGEHEFIVSEDAYDLFTSYIVPPSADEAFNVVLHHR